MTICTHGRSLHFRDATTVETTRLQILQTAEDESFAVLAYCFMPDHVHAVVEGQGPLADLRRFVRLAKQRTGYRFARSGRGRLWQEYFFDRTLWTDGAVTQAMVYVVTNPVRASLVDTPANYPHWGSRVYTRDELLAMTLGAERGRLVLQTRRCHRSSDPA